MFTRLKISSSELDLVHCEFLLLILIMYMMPSGSLKAGESSEISSGQKPNIIFILADDLGYRELGCYGNDFNETPHLDNMAAMLRSRRYSRAYSAAPVCSPTRAAIMTGMSPWEIGITDYLRPNSANALPHYLTTIAESLSDKGYSTGYIGKWHLTGYKFHGAEFESRPEDHGFQWSIATEVKGVGNGANFWPYVFRAQPIRWIDIKENRMGKDEYLTDRMNLEATDFIKRNKEKPFFLFLSHYAPHTILNGRPDLVEKYRKKSPPGPSDRTSCYICQDAGLEGDPLHHWSKPNNPHLAAMLESIDDGVGKIIQTLKHHNLLDNTLLIFTSDNGGESNVTFNTPLRGGKSQLHEGGIRVPLILHFPKNASVAFPKSAINRRSVSSDFYALFNAISSQPISTNPKPEFPIPRSRDAQLATNKAEGNSFPFQQPVKSIPIRWHYPLDKPHFLGGTSTSAVIWENWKLIHSHTDNSFELYDLEADESELVNQADKIPVLVSSLSGLLTSWPSNHTNPVPSGDESLMPLSLIFADHLSFPSPSARWSNLRSSLKSPGEISIPDDLEARTSPLVLNLPPHQSKAWILQFDIGFDPIKLGRNNNASPSPSLTLSLSSGQNSPSTTINLEVRKGQSINRFNQKATTRVIIEFQDGSPHIVTPQDVVTSRISQTNDASTLPDPTTITFSTESQFISLDNIQALKAKLIR